MADCGGHFVWYELMTTDMEAAEAFYADVVGWGTRNASTPGLAYTLFTAGETPVGGMMNLRGDAGKIGAEPRWIGYVGVDDVDAAVKRLEQLGGTVHVPPTDIAGISRFSVVADPQMATLVLVKWLSPALPEPAQSGRIGSVGWHELLAADHGKALDFYQQLLGWQKGTTEVGSIGTYQLFSAGGETIGGMFTKPPAVPMPFWLYYFRVGDIDAALKRVVAGGGEILEGPIEVPGGTWSARCVDAQGAMFALTGPRDRNIPGYFERAGSRERWSW